MLNAYPRVYRSFDDFERVELRSLDNLYSSVNDMVDELLMAELEDDGQKDSSDDGILFEQSDES